MLLGSFRAKEHRIHTNGSETAPKQPGLLRLQVNSHFRAFSYGNHPITSNTPLQVTKNASRVIWSERAPNSPQRIRNGQPMFASFASKLTFSSVFAWVPSLYI